MAAAGGGAATGGSGTGSGKIKYGTTYKTVATWYAAADGGGSCNYDKGGDLMIAAIQVDDFDGAHACGAFVQVTGPGGTIVVKIVDACPDCHPHALDLSHTAFQKIAGSNPGLADITWKLLSPPLAGPIQFRFKEGSSQYWCGVQVRNSRNPLRSLEAYVGGSWQQIPLTSWGYFVSEGGSGCGSRLRVTDIYGGQITTAGPVAVRSAEVQNGPAQFRAPA